MVPKAKSKQYSNYLLIFTIILLSVEWVSSECKWLEWKRSISQASCGNNRRLPFLAAIEQSNAKYRAKCCPDEESVSLEKENLEQCETTECLVSGDRNLCASLPTYFTGNGNEKIEYEVSIKDNCTIGTGRQRKNGTAAVCCPKDSIAGLLVSVSAAELNEHPFMAKTSACGATVYNKDFLITAAHCFVNSTTGTLVKPPYQVTLGTNLDELQSKTNTFDLAEIIIHEDCSILKGHPERNRKYQRYYNDIALLRLKKSIDFKKNPNIRPIEIAPRRFKPEEYSNQVVILGWGTTQLGRTSDHLQKSNILIRQDKLCFDKRLGRLGEKQYEVNEFSNQFLCLGGIVDGSVSNSAGKGDSGGPAICRDSQGKAVLCGVASFGSEYEEKECVDQRNEKYCQPSVYEDVGYFHDWIVTYAGRQDSSYLFKPVLYGEEIPRSHYPHQVRILVRGDSSCGGTLISTDALLTAAHCVITDGGEDKRDIQVLVGDRVYYPENIYHLPKFSRYNGLDSLNVSGRGVLKESFYVEDIAVIKLSKKVSGISNRQVAKLPNSIHFKTGEATEVAFQGSKLIRRKLNILTRRDCRRRVDRLHAAGVHVRLDQRKIMCGVETYSGGSTCDRELGGGLICKEEKTGRDIICGVQIFRMCELTLPSAFLNTGMYLDFIGSVIGK